LSQTKHTLLCGINYRNADVSLRDALGFGEIELQASLAAFLKIPDIEEVIILSTCNRTEIYASVAKPREFKQEICAVWANLKGLPADKVLEISYYFAHEKAVEHLFRVTGSLDSLIVGEDQILAQVKNAARLATEMKTTGLLLNALFQRALQTGKKIRTETNINQGAVSISFAAVELCKKVLENLNQARAGIIGTGEMGALAARYLAQAGVRDFLFINRSLESVQQLAHEFDGEVCLLKDFGPQIKDLDVLISCTAAPTYVLSKSVVESAIKSARIKNRILIDIAAPRDIEPTVADLDGIYLFSIDDLKQVVDENLAKRQEAVQQAEIIIKQELQEFYKWYTTIGLTSLIQQFREHTEAISKDELEKIRHLFDDAQYQIAEEFRRGLVAKLLHSPSVGIRSLAEKGYASEAALFLDLMVSNFRSKGSANE
jgi:glutamyl-tRNA reductase